MDSDQEPSYSAPDLDPSCLHCPVAICRFHKILTMVLEYYYDLRSQPCRAVYIFLKAAKVNFQAHKVDLPKGETRTPEFLKMNPLHKVPVIKDGDFVLTESVAMLRYIATKYKVSEHWYPRQDAKKQARVDEFLNWHHSGLRKPLVELIITKLRMRMALGVFTKIPFDAEKIKQLEESVANALKEMDEYFLRKKPFINGDEISVSDLIGYCEVMQLDAVDSTAFKSNENVNKWLKRVETKLGALNTEPAAALGTFKQMYAGGEK